MCSIQFGAPSLLFDCIQPFVEKGVNERIFLRCYVDSTRGRSTMRVKYGVLDVLLSPPPEPKPFKKTCRCFAKLPLASTAQASAGMAAALLLFRATAAAQIEKLYIVVEPL